MPVQFGRDAKGCWARWGGSGKKYRFPCASRRGKAVAARKAGAQGAAVKRSGWREKNGRKNKKRR